MSGEDWSPSDLPAVSCIRVATTRTDEAARQLERQRGQIALAAQWLGLRMVDEFVDVDCPIAGSDCWSAPAAWVAPSTP